MWRADCYRCEWHEESPERGYQCEIRTGLYDVDRALALARDGRRVITLHPKTLCEMAAADRWDRDVFEPHLAHVDVEKPGVMGMLAGARLVLIEGYHRAVVCARAYVPWGVLLLTPEETRRVTLQRAHVSRQLRSNHERLQIRDA